MSKQAIYLAEAIKQLPFSEQVKLLEMLVQEIKKQTFTVEKPAVKKRKAGFSTGTFVMSDDFNEPLEDFKEYM
jgi:hypothetical protein